MFYETVLKLCAEKGISLTSLMTDELHMSSGNITKWKNGIVPRSNTIQKIAEYFDVSTDYLLGNEQKNKPLTEVRGYSPEAINVLNQIEKLSPANQAKLSELIRLFLADQESK